MFTVNNKEYIGLDGGRNYSSVIEHEDVKLVKLTCDLSNRIESNSIEYLNGLLPIGWKEGDMYKYTGICRPY